MSYSSIAGAGGYLPGKAVSNQELANSVDTSDEWISSRTGIKQRHLASDGENTESMACHAGRRALQAAKVDAADIDMIIVATSTPEKVFPSVACMVQNELGVAGAAAFDLQAACSGFVYAIDVADKYIRGGDCQRALVIGSECMSRIVDWEDRNTCVLFGDGAGAVVMRATSRPGVSYSKMRADGSYNELLYTLGGPGSAEPKSHLQMDGRQVFRLAIELAAQDLLEAMQATGLGAEDVDWLVLHQANIRIMKRIAQKTGIAESKLICTVEQHGNTSAASIPLALNEGFSKGMIKPGHNLLLSGFGGGFTWGTTVIHYHGDSLA